MLGTHEPRKESSLLLKALPRGALGRKFHDLGRAPAGEVGVRWAPLEGQDAVGADKVSFIFTALFYKDVSYQQIR